MTQLHPKIDEVTRRIVERSRPTRKAYLDRIEALVEAPIKFVSVGTRRDQIIW